MNKHGRAGKDAQPGDVVVAFFDSWEHIGFHGREINGKKLPPSFQRARSRWRGGASVSRTVLSYWLTFFGFRQETFDKAQ